MAVIIDGQTASFNKAMAQSQGQLAGFQKSIGAVSGVLLATFGTAALFRGISDAVSIMAEFEHTMSTVKAITGATGDEFKALERDALKLGASTKFTSTQVGQLQIAYGRLGFNTKEILDATEATLDLAAATGEDLAKSADVAGSTVRGFGLKAKETQRVVDVMAKSFNTTALSLENFTESMKFVAPVAAAANLSVEDTTALLGTLADAGIRGSIAGTSLRKILTDLPKDARPFQERLAELAAKGITVADAFDEVGRTAQTSLLILAKNNDKTKELAASFQNVAGEASKMARIMQDNLQGDTEKLTSAWEGLILALGNTGPFRRATQGLTAFLNALSGTPDQDEALKNLVRGIKEESASATEQFIKDLQKIRQESGKPIDTAIVNELAEKYKLTSEQANKLFESLIEVNRALSFQEKAIQEFDEFVRRNGYKDLTKAVEDYKQSLYELILAEQIQKDGFIKTKAEFGNTEAFDIPIQKNEEQIASYRRVIDILNVYSKDFKKVEGEIIPITEKTILNLKFYQDALKKLNDEYAITAVKDKGRLENLEVQIDALDKIIFRIEKLKEIGFVEFQTPSSIKTDPITDPIDEAVIARTEAGLERLRLATLRTTTEIKESFASLTGPITTALVDISEAIGSAIAGVGNFGQDILKVVANFGAQLGKILIAEGVALLAVKLALKNPVGMIAAGVALIAITSALSAGISKSHSSTVGGGGSGGSTASSASPFTNTFGQSINFNAQFRISGNDLVAVLNSTNKQGGRLHG